MKTRHPRKLRQVHPSRRQLRNDKRLLLKLAKLPRDGARPVLAAGCRALRGAMKMQARGMDVVCEGCGERFRVGDYIYWPISGANEPVCEGCCMDGGRPFDYERSVTE